MTKLPRTVSLLLALWTGLTLALPNSAWALRSIQSRQSPEMVQVLTAGLEEAEILEAIAVLKIQTGREAVRNGKWAALVSFLEQTTPETVKALIENSRQTVSSHEQEWKKQGLLRGGGAAKLLIGDIGEAKRRASERLKKKHFDSDVREILERGTQIFHRSDYGWA